MIRQFLFTFSILALITSANAKPVATSDQWYSATPLLWPNAEKYLPQFNHEPSVRRNNTVELGEVVTFNTMNVAKNAFTTANGVLRRIGKHCYAYVEEGAEMSDATINRLVDRFDNVIYPTNHKHFGSEWSPGIDWDERVTLFFLDIQDGWAPGKGYVGGYFTPMDEMSTKVMPQSNEREMVYLDIYPANPEAPDYLGILAHEFQHMIHFNYDPAESIWLNEAMAQLAFYVNDYGHPSQIFGYIKKNDFSLFKFKENGAIAYGYAYLWIYYLTTKYFGDTPEKQAEATRMLVASKKKGLESIQEVLRARGVKKSLQEIFYDFSVAVFHNSRKENTAFGFDDSLKVKLQPKLMPLSSAQQGKEAMEPFSLRYFSFAKSGGHRPFHPTMGDKVTVYTENVDSTIIWNINSGELPPKALLPAGSQVDTAKKLVATKASALADGKFGVEIGNFVKKGVVVNQLNYKIVQKGKESPWRPVSIFSIPQLATFSTGSEDEAAGGEFRVAFSFGGTKTGRAFALVEKTDGSKTYVELKAASGKYSFAQKISADIDAVHIGLSAYDGKKIEVKFASEFVPAGKVASSDAATISARPGSPVKAMSKATTVQFASVKADSNDAITQELIRQVLAIAKNENATNKARSVNVSLEVPGFSPLADDKDKSHDNVGYMISKKGEYVHDLRHLMIAPQLEQLFKLWKLLELLRGFPHLSIPEGFAIKNFNEDRAIGLLRGWGKDFNVPYPFDEKFGKSGIGQPSAVKGSEEQVKETLRRMIVCESLIEFAYNNGLSLASDTAMSMYEFVRFFTGVSIGVQAVSNGFANVPVVGAIVKQITNIIQGKLLEMVGNFSWYIADRLKPPANLWVPILVNYAANAYARTIGISLGTDPFPGYSSKEMIIGVMGRYAIASVPKIGMVDRSQVALDMHADFAKGLKFAGTMDEVSRKLLDDGNPLSFNSTREEITKEVTERTRTNYKERQLARIGTRLTQVFQFASLIDPTSISKILTVASGVATTGVLVHSSAVSLGYLLKMTGRDMQDVATLSFNPRAVLPSSVSVSGRAFALGDDVAPQAQKALRGAMGAYLDQVEKLTASANASFSTNIVDEFTALDAELDEEISQTNALLSAVPGAVEDVFPAAQGLSMERASFGGKLIEAALQQKAVDDDAAANLRQAAKAYIAKVEYALQGIDIHGTSKKPLVIEGFRITKQGNDHVVEARVRNLSGETADGLEVRLVSGLTYKLSGKAAFEGVRIGAGNSAAFTWRLTLSDYDRKLPVKMLGIYASGTDTVAAMKNGRL